jgi:arachidonate 15-lipoxygenase (second type) / 8-lipoxygenase (S-type)
LGSLSHHAVNTNEILAISATLPFHPLALYKELPTKKGVVDNVASWLPPLDKIVVQFTTGGWFARPLLVGSNRTLVHMFDNQRMLNRMNEATRTAAAKFMTEMQAFSATVSSRKFDSQGLSQGMPFVWKGLDPNVIPWSATI